MYVGLKRFVLSIVDDLQSRPQMKYFSIVGVIIFVVAVANTCQNQHNDLIAQKRLKSAFAVYMTKSGMFSCPGIKSR